MINYLNVTVFLFSLCINCIAQAPTIQWAKCYGYGEKDNAKSIIQTNDGGYIVLGESYDFLDSTTIDNHGLYDFLVIKLDSAGTVEWQKFYGGSDYEMASQILQTSDSGYIMLGVTASIDGDVTVNHGGYDGWIVKLDLSGVIQWQQTIGGLNNDIANAIKEDYDGFIITGYTSSNDSIIPGNHGLEDYWITKIDNYGNVLWGKIFGGSSYDLATSVIVTSDSAYVIVGSTRSNDSDITVNHGSYDYWILKLDKNGNALWQKSFGGLNSDKASAITQTNDGSFLIAGSSDSNDGDVSGNHGYGDYWMLKLDSAGNFLSQKCIGGSSEDVATSIFKATTGHFVVAGYSISNDGDATFCNGSNDFWILEIDSAANIIWQKSLGGSGVDVPFSIIQTNDSGFIVAGLTKSSNDGDVSGHIGGDCFGDSCSDFWIVKLVPLYTSLFPLQFQQTIFSIDPNPTSQNFTLKLQVKTENGFIEIRNVLGELLFTDKVLDMEYSFDINFPSGVYFVSLFNEQNKSTKKLVVQ